MSAPGCGPVVEFVLTRSRGGSAASRAELLRTARHLAPLLDRVCTLTDQTGADDLAPLAVAARTLARELGRTAGELSRTAGERRRG